MLRNTAYKDGTSQLDFYGIAITRSVHSSEVYERVGFVCKEGVPDGFRKLPDAHTPKGLAKCKTFTLIICVNDINLTASRVSLLDPDAHDKPIKDTL